jgi:hypothetical protein
MSQLEKIQFDEEKFVSLLGKLVGEAKFLQVRAAWSQRTVHNF